MRAAFYELATANYLRMGGCTVDARPEIKVKGADYDLTAIREGQHFAVEVTALAAEEFSPSTLLNALNNKRKQLPKELPSIIFCVMPETWLAGIRDWSADTSATMVSFIRNTRRVNAVVLLKEEHVTAPGGYSGALALSAQPVFSLRPRVELDMDFLKIGPSGEPLDQGPFGGLVGEDVDPSEFFEWVRSLAPS